MLKLVVLAILTVPSIMASTSERIAKALIAEKDKGKLEQTFQRLHKEHGDGYSSWALDEVVKQGHLHIVVACLRTERDPFPNDEMCVSRLVHYTFSGIFDRTRGNSEAFVKVITSFKPTDVKPLASIRRHTLGRSDVVNVLKGVMDKSPELIIDGLPSWLASHRFDRNSCAYIWNQTAREEAFPYLASFATQSVLEKALSIVSENEHHKADLWSGLQVMCCMSQDCFPQDLVDKLTGLLKLVRARNELVKETLSFMPGVLLNLMAEYTTYEKA
jgi:hypothetical protein